MPQIKRGILDIDGIFYFTTGPPMATQTFLRERLLPEGVLADTPFILVF